MKTKCENLEKANHSIHDINSKTWQKVRSLSLAHNNSPAIYGNSNTEKYVLFLSQCVMITAATASMLTSIHQRETEMYLKDTLSEAHVACAIERGLSRVF